MRKYALLALIPLVFFLDRLTKVLIINNLALFENISITSFFSLVHVRNLGGAFSFLHDYRYAQYIFTILPIIIAACLLYVILTYAFPMTKTLSLILILAGALGNIYDRISYGNVVDFLDFYYSKYHWPAFNIADISVSCGIGLWIYAELFLTKKEPDKKQRTEHKKTTKML